MFRHLTKQELLDEYNKWRKAVHTASGWPSAYFAAKQLEHICAESRTRGMNLINPHPIRKEA